jgi:hypothetical protein
MTMGALFVSGCTRVADDAVVILTDPLSMGRCPSRGEGRGPPGLAPPPARREGGGSKGRVAEVAPQLS